MPHLPKPHIKIESRASLRGHPLHPVLIHFPIAALVMLLFTDLAYVVTDDPFWSRAGYWLSLTGVVFGTLSGIAGAIDLFLVGRIRRLVTAWAHGILAVMMLS